MVLVGLVPVVLNKLNSDAVSYPAGGQQQPLLPTDDDDSVFVFDLWYVDTEPSVGTLPFLENGTGRAQRTGVLMGRSLGKDPSTTRQPFEYFVTLSHFYQTNLCGSDRQWPPRTGSDRTEL